MKSKINNVNVDVHADNKGRMSYAIVFNIDAWNTRYGISLGSDFTTKEEDLYLSLDSASLYTITIDPTVTATSEDVYLGVRSIELNNKKIFEASTVTSVISGVALLLLSLVIFYFIFLRRG